MLLGLPGNTGLVFPGPFYCLEQLQVAGLSFSADLADDVMIYPQISRDVIFGAWFRGAVPLPVPTWNALEATGAQGG